MASVHFLHHVCVGIVLISLGHSAKYDPNWDSLDSRPLPDWYDDAKLGMFINWGVYTVPSFADEWFWYRWKGPSGEVNPAIVKYMKENYPPGFTYQDFAAQLKLEFYNPKRWMKTILKSGVKYIVLSTKHHEGFTMYPSKYSFNWNAMDVGPKKDLIGEMAKAINGSGIHFGLYHSLFEWFNPIFLKDQENKYTTQDFVFGKTLPELYEIVENYKPDVVWSDGHWMAPSGYWNSSTFIAWLYNESPVKDTVVTNDRWGSDTMCKHGGFLTCHDRYNPGVLQKRKWENAMTLDRQSWGFRRDASLEDFFTIEQLLKTIITTVSCGGNILMNVGPTPAGIFSPIYEERFTQLGSWLDVNGPAIYKTKPWTYQNDTLTKDIWYTQSKATPAVVYGFFLEWPKEPFLLFGAPKSTRFTTVQLLGYSPTLQWEDHPHGGMIVSIPPIPHSQMPCSWAWALAFSYLDN
ncbi:hypothetical protein FSP39_003516 [Pinctada imbricata]|uniref:alpha-L-fucosidase n=1 Tax=Pinctada imbricata TaxID=66713 RepID=A0AA89C517_PINIB|nr:hypothetical protein FSP39_003516 [Pinctada imbricata]